MDHKSIATLKVHKIITPLGLLKALETENYYFANRAGHYPRSNKIMKYRSDVRYSKFAAILSGDEIVTTGAYSYSWSPLPRGTVIGAYCSIAKGLKMMGVRHPIERFTTSSITYDQNTPFFVDSLKHGFLAQVPNSSNFVPPIIEDDVWVGEDVLLGSGVTLGTGCVVAARSIVTKDVAPYHIVAGSPAKTIKIRFPEDVSAELLKSGWTKYDVKDLRIRADVPIDQFLEAYVSARIDGKIQKLSEPVKFSEVIYSLSKSL